MPLSLLRIAASTKLSSKSSLNDCLEMPTGMSASPLFQTWCDLEEVTVSEHRLVVLTERSNTRATIEPRLDRVVLDNYDDISRLERWAKHLGMTNAAAVLEEALPTELKAQSGHVGEICLTECI